VFEPCESSGGCVSQQSWQSCAAPASPGALVQLAVVPPLLDPLLVLEPLLLVDPLLLEVLPLLLLVDPLLLEVLPLLDEVLLPEPLELLLPASLLKPGVVAVLEQPAV
jgi:hypothetical protein